MPASCEYLNWDSEFFNLRIARLYGHTLDEALIKDALIWCEQNKIDCLYFLADPAFPNTIHILEQSTFKLVDIRMTLAHNLNPRPRIQTSPNIALRPGQLSDLPTLSKMATENHTQTRFFTDPNFGVEKAKSLYAAWIENSLHGYADIVMVAEYMNQIAGYITGHLNSIGKGQIGLVGVSKEARGQGVGNFLVQGILHWFQQHNVEEIQVVTQGSNIPALNLYEKTGFSIASIYLWYHKWFS